MIVELDARGLNCPMPLLKAKQALNKMDSGARLRVVATDKGAWRDFAVFADQSGNLLLEKSENDGEYTFVLEKQ